MGGAHRRGCASGSSGSIFSTKASPAMTVPSASRLNSSHGTGGARASGGRLQGRGGIQPPNPGANLLPAAAARLIDAPLTRRPGPFSEKSPLFVADQDIGPDRDPLCCRYRPVGGRVVLGPEEVQAGGGNAHELGEVVAGSGIDIDAAEGAKVAGDAGVGGVGLPGTDPGRRRSRPKRRGRTRSGSPPETAWGRRGPHRRWPP